MYPDYTQSDKYVNKYFLIVMFGTPVLCSHKGHGYVSDQEATNRLCNPNYLLIVVASYITWVPAETDLT